VSRTFLLNSARGTISTVKYHKCLVKARTATVEISAFSSLYEKNNFKSFNGASITKLHILHQELQTKITMFTKSLTFATCCCVVTVLRGKSARKTNLDRVNQLSHPPGHMKCSILLKRDFMLSFVTIKKPRPSCAIPYHHLYENMTLN